MWNIRHRHTPLTLAAMLLALLLSACVTTDDYSDQDSLRDDETVSLTLNIYTNQPYAATRALTGDVNGRTDQPESIIYDIQVWAFTHNGGDNEQAIAYAEAENINKSELEMRMYISKEHVVAKHKLDLYILANPKSIGLTGNNKVPASITRATLKATSFGNDHFGTTTLTHAVPTSQGLPISQVYKGTDGNGIDISDLLVSTKRVNIELRRAISKLRFIFSRAAGTDGVQITKIEINQDLIPTSQFVFPNESNLNNMNLSNIGSSPTYVTDKIIYSNASAPILNDNQIATTADPELLRSDSPANSTKSAQAYEDFINGKITPTTGNPEATEYGLTYLRESDKKISGTIYYKYSATGEEKSKTFEMDATNDDTNFVRNHTWNVYAYFLGGGLYVVPQVMPWQWGGELTFMSKTTVQLSIDNTYNMYGNEQHFKYLMYSPDENNDGTPDYGNWANNYCAIAYGFDGSRPTYSPWMVLRTTSMQMLQLQTDNTEFGFVLVNKEEGTYSSVLDELEIPAGKGVETNFYVVPKENLNLSNPPNRFVNVMLIERATSFSDGNTPEVSVNRLPWNSELPGTESHETAQFYWVTATEYSQNMDGTAHTLQIQPQP